MKADPLSSAFASMKAQRDACVEALRTIARCRVNDYWANVYELKRSIQIAKAALAKIEKEKP